MIAPAEFKAAFVEPPSAGEHIEKKIDEAIKLAAARGRLTVEIQLLRGWDHRAVQRVLDKYRDAGWLCTIDAVGGDGRYGHCVILKAP